MGEIHDALKRAAAAMQAKAEAQQPEPEGARTSTTGPGAPEVVAAARGELLADHSSDAPEMASVDQPPRERLQISRERRGDWAPRAVVVAEPGGSAEAYRHFAIRVRRELAQRSAKSALVVSALRGEGKTTTSCNLALALATMSGGERVALIDLDLRRPSVGHVFGALPTTGIDDVLRQHAKLDEARLPTDLPTLDIYPVATQMHDPHVHLSGVALDELFAELHARYQTVVVDSPPLLLVPDAALILPHVGGAIPVMRPRHTRRRSFEQMIGRMPQGSLLGCFLNQARTPGLSEHYGYYTDAPPSSETDE